MWIPSGRGSGESRKSIAEALTTVSMALLLPRRVRPDNVLVRRALFKWAFNTGRRTTGTPPTEFAEVLAWVSGASRPVSSLRDLAVIRSVLDALTVRLDGKPAAATSVYRKRAVFYNALGLAVELRHCPRRRAVDTAAQPNPRTRRGPEPAR